MMQTYRVLPFVSVCGNGVASLIPDVEHSARATLAMLLHALGEEELVAVLATNVHACGHLRKFSL